MLEDSSQKPRLQSGTWADDWLDCASDLEQKALACFGQAVKTSEGRSY